MKTLILILILAGCSSAPLKEYREKNFRSQVHDPRPVKEVYDLLMQKMRKCYRDQLVTKFVPTGIEGEYSEENQFGMISYLVDQELGLKRIHHVDIFKDGKGTLVKIYSEGGAFTTIKDFKRNIPAWLAGEKVFCRGRGKI